jgi:hypothetical protein
MKALLYLENKESEKKSLDIKYDLGVLIVDLTVLCVYIIGSFAFFSVKRNSHQ